MASLPYPQLNARRFGAHLLPALSDDALFEACGVRIAFTSREGGVSEPPFDSLNLGSAVNDDPIRVRENRRILLKAFDAGDCLLLAPKQVHGDRIVMVDDSSLRAVARKADQAAQGADAILATVPGVAALLCFADCVPVILVSPTGRFAVVHAGWRGVMCGIAGKAARMLAQLDAQACGCSIEAAASELNGYIGPHIRKECFETGEELCARFVEKYGFACKADASHVSLVDALRIDLSRAGVCEKRIADAGICTVCSSQEYFSYRAADGICGRHGAFAFRKEADCEL